LANATLGTANKIVYYGRDRGRTSNPYHILVMGDSVVWGQGLETEEKFSAIVKKRLSLLIGSVEVMDESHSGATIRPRDKAFLTEPGEVPTFTPTLW
jgi:hypothetical protein